MAGAGKKKRNKLLSSEEMAEWLIEALEYEAEALEGAGPIPDGRRLEVRLVKGRMVQTDGPHRFMVRFLNADGVALPEDLPGTFLIGQAECPAWVRRQTRGEVWLEIDHKVFPPEEEWAGTFVLDREAHIAQTIELIETMGSSSDSIQPLASELFFPELVAPEKGDRPVQTPVLENDLDSRLVYWWAWPGSDWERHTAAAIVDLARSGQRVLITGPYNKTLDRVCTLVMDIWPEAPLFWSGWTESGRLPTSATWAGAVRQSKARREEAREEIQDRIRHIDERIEDDRRILGQWDALTDKVRDFDEMATEMAKIHGSLAAHKSRLEKLDQDWRIGREAVLKARKAWVDRRSKEAKALQAFRAVERLLDQEEKEAGLVRREKEQWEKKALQLSEEIEILKAELQDVPDPETIRHRRAGFEAEKDSAWASMSDPDGVFLDEPTPALDQARIVMAGWGLLVDEPARIGSRFDTVILVEAHALDTAGVFLAAARAENRVVLAGDFARFHFEAPSGRRGKGSVRKALTPDLLGAYEKEPTAEVSVSHLTAKPRPAPALLAWDLVYGPLGLTAETFSGLESSVFLTDHPRLEWTLLDIGHQNSWCGRDAGGVSRFNLTSALASVAAAFHFPMAEPSRDSAERAKRPIVTPYQAQAALIQQLILDLNLEERFYAATLDGLVDGTADLVVFDSTLDDPTGVTRWTDEVWSDELAAQAASAVAVAQKHFILVESSDWWDKKAAAGAMGKMRALMLEEGNTPVPGETNFPTEWNLGMEAISIQSALDRAQDSVFGFLPAWSGDWWNRFGSSLTKAASRGVPTVVFTPPSSEAEDAETAVGIVKALQMSGAVWAPAVGLSGKELVVDDRVYWPASGRENPVVPVLEAPGTAGLIKELLQIEKISAHLKDRAGSPRSCPLCGWPTQLVFQPGTAGDRDGQPFKVACANPKCRYLRSLDERLPYLTPPVCPQDGRTQFRRIKRGKVQVWQCPVHAGKCPREAAVPGDPS